MDLPAAPAQPSGAEAEAREERMLKAGTGDIYDIPRAEWMKLQVRQQPCMPGRWTPRAGGQAAKDRQLPATPWGADAGCTEATHAVLGQPSWWGFVTYSAGAVDARPRPTPSACLPSARPGSRVWWHAQRIVPFSALLRSPLLVTWAMNLARCTSHGSRRRSALP